jgi:hypothetical protein
MAPTRTRQRQTRKKANGKVLDVRSEKQLSMFDKLVVHGPVSVPVTLTFVKKEGCGPCEQFHENVWSPLTKLKHKMMNLATIDSEVYDKSGLPPVSQYPTIMLVGKDKKPAVFNDETGTPTNSFPRKPTLEEDFHSLKTLVTQIPPMPLTPNKTAMLSRANTRNALNRPSPIKASNSLIARKNSANSMMRETSPYDKEETVIPSKISETEGLDPIRSEPVEAYSEKTTFTPPKISEDVSSTAVKSQVPGAPSGIAASIQLQRGGLLQSIRDYTDSLKSILKMRRKKNKRTRGRSGTR